VKIFAHKCREVIPLALSFIGFGIAIVTVWFFLLRPWPGVTAAEDWTLINPPADGVYSTGDLVSWEKSNVCVPAGETTVQIFLVQEVPPEFGGGELRRLAYTRIFYLEKADCRNPNYTSLMVPFDTLPGSYDILLRACTNSPSPIDTCVETPGPTLLVGERDSRIQRLDR
jgi:hypothetical protein